MGGGRRKPIRPSSLHPPLSLLRLRRRDGSADDLLARRAQLAHLADQASVDAVAIRNFIGAQGLGVGSAGLPLLQSLTECAERGGRCQNSECECGAINHGPSLPVSLCLPLKQDFSVNKSRLRPPMWRSRGFGWDLI